jgi:hypothetical protein
MIYGKAYNNFLTNLFLCLLKCFSQRNKHTQKKLRITLGDIVGFVGFGELRFALLQNGLVAPKWIEKKCKFKFVKT